MAKISENSIFDRRRPFPNSNQLSSLALSEFITSSSSMKSNPNQKYPINYPYNIYNDAAWEVPLPYQDLQNDEEEQERNDKCKRFWWWQPNQDSIPAEFLESSSMHGLKYVSQPKRHIVERLFWLGSFLSCVIGATVMICEIWQRYYDNPVIVTFNPSEMDVDTIPFPAITICNTNPFTRSRVKEFENIYKTTPILAEKNAALDALRIINSLCSAQPSFLKSLEYAPTRGVISIPEAMKSPSEEAEKNLTQFLLKNTRPCSELLRICVWEQEVKDCERLFKPLITDYGKCCTFNMLPQDLMEYQHSSTQQTRIAEGSRRNESAWSKEEVDDWSKWNYDVDGYILNQELKYPRRQRRAGIHDGLSLLIDPDLENNFCPSTDSEGIKVLYHTPLDAPRVADLGLIVGVEREVFMEVNPDLTIADDGIGSYSHDSRKCYFGLEYKLDFYKPYTRSNCLEECWIGILFQNCSCVLYYTPHNSSTPICSNNPESKEYKCVKANEKEFLGKLHRICHHCKYSCNDLEYNAEVTYAQLQSNDKLWGDRNNSKNGTKSKWMSHRVAILHIFMGADSTVPKLRQKLYQAVDLIANTGGLLGLSIGFSVLSAVEIVYFATMRFCCKRLYKSKRFGKPRESKPGSCTQTNEALLRHQQQLRIQQNTYNRFGHLNNGDFLREMGHRNVEHNSQNNSNLAFKGNWQV